MVGVASITCSVHLRVGRNNKRIRWKHDRDDYRVRGFDTVQGPAALKHTRYSSCHNRTIGALPAIHRVFPKFRHFVNPSLYLQPLALPARLHRSPGQGRKPAFFHASFWPSTMRRPPDKSKGCGVLAGHAVALLHPVA
jgi:hypothetical protein